MRYIFGLGNPGAKYELTRHNVGFLFLDYFLEEFPNQLIEENKYFKSYLVSTKFGDFTIIYPQMYMNLSGQIVRIFYDEGKINDSNYIIIYDDYHLPFGKIRLRPKGSHAGHNGIRNIIDCIGTDKFNRLRIGIGEPDINIIDYVLGQFTNNDLDKLPELFAACSNAVLDWSDKSFKYVMDNYNGKMILD